MTSLILPTDLWYLIYQFIPSDRLVLQLPLIQRRRVLKRLTGLDIRNPDRFLTRLGNGDRQAFARPELWPYFEAKGLLTDQALIESEGTRARALVWSRYPKGEIPLKILVYVCAYSYSNPLFKMPSEYRISDIARYIRRHRQELDPAVINRIQMMMVGELSNLSTHIVRSFTTASDALFLRVLRGVNDGEYEYEVDEVIGIYGTIELVREYFIDGIQPPFVHFIRLAGLDPEEVKARVEMVTDVIHSGYYSSKEVRDAIEELDGDGDEMEDGGMREILVEWLAGRPD